MQPKPTTSSYSIAQDEKVLPLMIYTLSGVARGEMVIKQSIRLSTWLRSASPADYLLLHRAQVLFLGSGGHLHTYALPKYLLPSPSILAAHVLPPAQETLDYDPSEPNRKMEPTQIFFGTFHLQCNIRMSAATNLGTYLTTAKEVFLTIYDVEITNPEIPNMGIVKAPLVYIRPASMSFSSRPST
jgi:hypothetical protein